jgi:hypothetical protein
MKKLTTVFSFLLVVLLMSSCKNDKSLQTYLVDTSGKEGFYTGDIPVSSVLSPKADVSEDVKETMQSIKKINVVFLPKTEANETSYQTEKAKLKEIFKDNEDYKSLMAMKLKGMNVSVFYSGKTEAIDEIVAFGYGDQNGVGVVRLLGDDMDPSKIVKMLSSVEMDENSLGNLGNIFNAN